ncbi:MAG: hypothetical protein P8Y37_13490 [Anaerolineales bacterium]
MSGTARYWRDWSESQLASYQGDQGSSNHCAKYAAASALNLLYETSADGGELVSVIGDRLLKGTGRYTILGNDNGSLVFQAANLLRMLARLNGVNPRIRCRRIDRNGLFSSLKEDKTLALVSLTYWQGSARWVGGHVMIPAAYDPDHINQTGFSTPWGFLSSWGSEDELYWMTENDFQRTWGQLSIYNTVTVNRPED